MAFHDFWVRTVYGQLKIFASGLMQCWVQGANFQGPRQGKELRVKD